jgi:SAM-dependent methyltransferase
MNRIHRWLCSSRTWRSTIDQRVPWVLARADLGQDILEIGPGPGLATDLLRSRARRITAIEIDPELAEQLRSRLHGSNVEVVVGDATMMPFPNVQFSGGIAMTMLHHIPSPELQNQLLREVWRVLRPGGSFVGSDSLPSLMMRLIHIGDTFVPVSPDAFGIRLETAGFKVLEIETGVAAFRFHAQKCSIQPQVPGGQDTG